MAESWGDLECCGNSGLTGLAVDCRVRWIVGRKEMVMSNRSPQIEGWLKGQGVVFRYEENIDLSRISLTLSHENQARAEALEPALVAQYVSMSKEGLVAPPCVFYEDSQRRLVAVDGNHRIASAGQVGGTVDGYICDLPADRVQALTFAANRDLNGLPPTQKWLDRQCVVLAKEGWREQDIVDLLRLPGRHTVKRAVNIHEWEVRASRLGMQRAEKLSDELKSQTKRLHSDEAFKELCNAVVENNLSPSKALANVGALNRLPDCDQLQAVRDLMKPAGRRGPRNMTAKHHLDIAFGHVEKMAPFDLVSAVPPHERSLYKEKCEALVEQAKRLAAVL